MLHTPTRDRAVAWLCAVVGAALTLGIYTHFTDSLLIDARFLGALAVTTIIPGFAVTRRFDGFPWPVRLGVSFVLGLGPLLIGWALAVLTGLTALLYVVPLLVALAAIVLQRRGNRERVQSQGRARAVRPMKPMPWWASLILLASWVLMLRSLVAGVWGRTSPSGRGWYVDLYWHLSLTAESMHSVPPRDPQSVVDGMLSYHWFSNAFGAAMSMASGLTSGHGLYSVGVIGWYLPVAAATIFVVYGLGLVLSRSHAAASLATVLLVLGPDFLLVRSLDPGASSALVWLSPSHMFALPVATFAVWVIVDLLRTAAPSRGQWLCVAYILLLCPGSKVSIIPTLLGGVALVALVTVVRRRRLLPIGLLLAGMVALVLLTNPFFAGGGGGTHLSYGATATQLRMWPRALSDSWHDRVMIALVMWLMCTAFLPSLVTFAAWRKRSLRDPAVPFYFGALAVGLVTMFFLKHPSLSQVYFMRGLTPVTAAFVAWGLTVALRRRPRVAVVGFVVLAISMVWSSTSLFHSTAAPRLRWVLPLVAVTAVLFLGLVLILLRGSRVAVAACAAAVVGWSCAPGAIEVKDNPLPALDAHVTSRSTVALTAGEVRMAQVLARQGSGSDLIATNVHCLPTRSRPHCDSRGFWPSGLTEKPVLVGAWAYSSSARERQGVGGYSYMNQPYVNAPIWHDNEAVFTQPSREAVQRLKQRGVKFLYADARAGAVSPDLPKYATRIASDGPVAIYRLP